MITFEEAEARLLTLAPRLPLEQVAIDNAHGRVLGEDVLSACDLPPFTYSAMDGYAAQSADFAGEGPWRFLVWGESRTGRVPPALSNNSVMRIFTGAEIPEGADTVVMQERVERSGDCATFDTRPQAGSNVRLRGEDLARGAVAVPRGTRLGPAHVSLLAMLDRTHLMAARKPVVEILSTGDELRPPGNPSVPGSIPESNGVALRVMAESCGATARTLPIARDERREIERAVEAALDRADVLITVGGVSVGDHDLVRPALEQVGVVLDFWKVAIKPGKPLAVGRRGGKIVMGLPGNPASALITFALFGMPLLRAMQGDMRPFPLPLRARLTRACAHATGRMEFVRAALARTAEGLLVTPVRSQASGSIVGLAGADALLRIPANATGCDAGDSVDVFLLSELCA